MTNRTKTLSRKELAAEIAILKRDRDRLHQLLAADRQCLQFIADYLNVSGDFTITNASRLNKDGVAIPCWHKAADMAPPPSLEYLMTTRMSSSVFL